MSQAEQVAQKLAGIKLLAEAAELNLSIASQLEAQAVVAPRLVTATAVGELNGHVAANGLHDPQAEIKQRANLFGAAHVAATSMLVSQAMQLGESLGLVKRG